jgi:hypothetical protein
MTALGQKRRFGNVCIISALPPKADIHRKGGMSHLRVSEQPVGQISGAVW